MATSGFRYRYSLTNTKGAVKQTVKKKNKKDIGTYFKISQNSTPKEGTTVRIGKVTTFNANNYKSKYKT